MSPVSTLLTYTLGLRDILTDMRLKHDIFTNVALFCLQCELIDFYYINFVVHAEC